MRGSGFQEPTGNINSENVAEVAKKPEATSTIGENSKEAQNGSVWFWAGLLGIYLFWDWVQNKEGVKESLAPSNIRANFHNLLIIGLGAVVIINGMNVFFTKLASMKIPVVSKVAGNMLPLFNL